MAKTSKAPDPLRRRHLAEEALAPAKALAVAESFLAAGQRHDALGFLAKAGETGRLRALRAEAVTAGDVFLVREIGALLGEEPDAATWNQVAEAATAAGKERYAAEARRLAAARAGERSRAT